MKILTAYDPSSRAGQISEFDDLTEQSHKDACDVNTIMAKYQKTGLIDHVNKYEGVYGDVTGADYREAMELICSKKTEFYELPSSIREQFNNDPAEYLELLQTDQGIEELTNMLSPRAKAPVTEKIESEPSQEATEEGDQDKNPVT